MVVHRSWSGRTSLIQRRGMDFKQAIRVAEVVIRSRWFVLFASFILVSFCGATYIFGLYSGAIKSALNYDQQMLTMLGFCKDVGANVGILAGLVNQVAPPWAVLAAGAVMNMTGYLMMWLSVTGRVAEPKIWQMNLYILIAANSQSFTNTATLVTCVKNFPQSRGIVLGLLKGFAGLSGAIFTQLYRAIYGDDPNSLILLIGWLPSVVTLMLMFMVRLKKASAERNELNRFHSFLYIALSLAGFLMVVIIIRNRVRFPIIISRLAGAAVVVFLLAPLVVVVKAELDKMKLQPWKIPGSGNGMEIEAAKHVQSDHTLLGSNNPEKPIVPEAQRPPIGDSDPVDGDRHGDIESAIDQSGKFKHDHAGVLQIKSTPGTVTERGHTEMQDNEKTTTEKRNIAAGWKMLWKLPKGPKKGEDFTVLQALMSPDFWLLYTATACGIGSCLAAIDNMGQIGTALGFSNLEVNSSVSLMSIWNFLGRVLSGFASEFFLKKYHLPRPVLLCFVLVFSCVGHLMIAFAVPGSLYVASVIVGFCFGAQWPVTFAMISELFGLKYYSTIFNVESSAIPVGSYLLSVRVAGFLYDREAAKQYANHITAMGSASDPVRHLRDLACKGASCYRLTFIIMALVSLFGALISGVLSLRTRDFYREDLDSKYNERPHEKEGQEETYKA